MTKQAMPVFRSLPILYS